jgi:hypothetical protein
MSEHVRVAQILSNKYLPTLCMSAGPTRALRASSTVDGGLMDGCSYGLGASEAWWRRLG